MDVNWHSLPVELQTIILDFALADPEPPFTPIVEQIKVDDTCPAAYRPYLRFAVFLEQQDLLQDYLRTTASHSHVRTVLKLAGVSSAWRHHVACSINNITTSLNLMLDVVEAAKLETKTRLLAAAECFSMTEKGKAPDAPLAALAAFESLRIVSGMHACYDFLWHDLRLRGESNFYGVLSLFNADWVALARLAAYEDTDYTSDHTCIGTKSFPRDATWQSLWPLPPMIMSDKAFVARWDFADARDLDLVMLYQRSEQLVDEAILHVQDKAHPLCRDCEPPPMQPDL